MRYEVTMKYNPGVPVKYVIEAAIDCWDARNQVRKLIGYDPGVSVEIKELFANGRVFKFSSLGHGDLYC